MLDLVTHDDAVPRRPAVTVAGGLPLTYGDLAGAVERALRHDGKAPALCAGDRDLPTPLVAAAQTRGRSGGGVDEVARALRSGT